MSFQRLNHINCHPLYYTILYPDIVHRAVFRMKNYTFSFGRYSAVVKDDTDTEPFEEKMARLTGELSELFAQSHVLEEEIRQKLGAIGYDI